MELEFKNWINESVKQPVKVSKELIEELHLFIESSKKTKFGASRWIGDDQMKVYVRKSKRQLKDQLVDCFDVASIEVYPQFQNQGLGGTFLKIAHEANPYFATYIENVMDENLMNHLQKNGWMRTPDSDSIIPSFYKLKDF